MGRLYDLIEDHRDRQRPYVPSIAQVAQQVGVSRQTLLNWRAPTRLPDKDHLVGLARVTGVPYERVLDAALDDTGYLHADKAAPRAKRGRKATPTSADRTSR